MKNLLVNGVKLIGGASSLYSILGTLLVAGGLFGFFHHKFVSVPIQNAKDKTIACIAEVSVKDETIAEAGRYINDLKQKIYDCNMSRIDAQISNDIKLINCTVANEELKQRIGIEEVNSSDEFSYTNFYF